MTKVSFGDASAFATVFYDRATRICVVVANHHIHLPDALAVAKSLGTDSVTIVAPPMAVATVDGLKVNEGMCVYDLETS